MIDQLKELKERSTISIENTDAIDFLETEQSTLVNINICSIDDSEFIILELDDFYFVSHNFDIDPRYYLYQIINSGSIEDLEQDGYLFLNEDMEFRSKIVNKENTKPIIYKHSDIGAVYELTENNSDNPIESLCEYYSTSNYLTNMLIIKKEDELIILQGMEVSETDFKLE